MWVSLLPALPQPCSNTSLTQEHGVTSAEPGQANGRRSQKPTAWPTRLSCPVPVLAFGAHRMQGPSSDHQSPHLWPPPPGGVSGVSPCPQQDRLGGASPRQLPCRRAVAWPPGCRLAHMPLLCPPRPRLVPLLHCSRCPPPASVGRVARGGCTPSLFRGHSGRKFRECGGSSEFQLSSSKDRF